MEQMEQLWNSWFFQVFHKITTIHLWKNNGNAKNGTLGTVKNNITHTHAHAHARIREALCFTFLLFQLFHSSHSAHFPRGRKRKHNGTVMEHFGTVGTVAPTVRQKREGKYVD